MDENDLKENNNINSLTYNGLLDKLQTLKEFGGNSAFESKKISLIKTAGDDAIQNVVNVIMDNPRNSPVIGCRKVLRFIQKDKILKKLEIYEYNYLISKKFPYLKNQVIADSEIIIFIINIYERRCIENFKKIFDEMNEALKLNNKVIKALLIKSTDNFLLKLTEDSSMESCKKEIKSIVNNNNIIFIEIELDDLKETDNLLIQIIKN